MHSQTHPRALATHSYLAHRICMHACMRIIYSGEYERICINTAAKQWSHSCAFGHAPDTNTCARAHVRTDFIFARAKPCRALSTRTIHVPFCTVSPPGPPVPPAIGLDWNRTRQPAQTHCEHSNKCVFVRARMKYAYVFIYIFIHIFRCTNAHSQRWIARVCGVSSTFFWTDVRNVCVNVCVCVLGFVCERIYEYEYVRPHARHREKHARHTQCVERMSASTTKCRRARNEDQSMHRHASESRPLRTRSPRLTTRICIASRSRRQNGMHRAWCRCKRNNLEGLIKLNSFRDCGLCVSV